MKNTVRILCVVLAILMAVSCFAACKKADNTDDTSAITSVAPAKVEIEKSEYYSIAEGSDIVVPFKDNEKGTTVMMVAEGTTMEQFLQVVKPAEKCTIKILGADGKEITDPKTVLTNDMTFEVYKEGEAKAVVSHKIQIVTKEQLVEALQEIAAEASRVASEIAAQSNASVAPGDDPVGPGGGGGGTSGASGTSGGGGGGKGEFILASHANFNDTSDERLVLLNSTLSAKANELGYSYTAVQDPNLYSGIDQIVTTLTAGKYADLLYVQCVRARELAKKGVLQDLSGVANLGSSWVSQGAVNCCAFGGKYYSISPTGMGTNPMGITYNKEFVAAYWKEANGDVDYLYNLYKNKAWTLSKFNSMLKDCSVDTTGDNIPDIYGTTSDTNIIGQALSAFAGGTDGMDANGHIYACFTTTAGINSLDWCRQIKADKWWHFRDDYRSALTEFATTDVSSTSGAASVVHYMSEASAAVESATFSVGFVPMPITAYDGGNQYDYVSQSYNTTMFVVPINCNSLSDSAAVASSLASCNDQLINLQLQGYYAKGYTDKECDVFIWCLSNMSADYSGGLHSNANYLNSEGKTVSQVIDECVIRDKDVTQAMNSIASLAQSEINDYYHPLTGQ